VFLLSLIFLFTLTLYPEQLICEKNILEKNEDFYRKILVSSNDSSVVLEYVKKQGHCFKEGSHLIEIRGIPIVESYLCDIDFKDERNEYFFKDGKLCSKSAVFFPSRNVFYIDHPVKIDSVIQGWETVSSKNSKLFYRSNQKFEELSGVNGRKLNISKFNLFTDDINRPVYPYFVFIGEKWQSVLPLREMFKLDIKPDGKFTILIITDSSLSYEKDELVDTIGLKADLFQIEIPEPCRYFISGSNISGVRIPKLSVSQKSFSFHGSYIIRLSYEGITENKPKIFSEENFEITVSTWKNRMEVTLTVFSKDLSVNEVERITAIINQETPPFHIIKKDAKK